MQIIIQVRGGVVASVQASARVDVTVVDWDEINAGEDRPTLPAGCRYEQTGDLARDVEVSCPLDWWQDL